MTGITLRNAVKTQNCNFLKNLADDAQRLSYWNAAVENDTTARGIDENIVSIIDNKQVAELLLLRRSAMNGQDRLMNAIENPIKFKYHSQIPEMFSAAKQSDA